MTAERCELRDEFCRSSDFGLENALAAHVRGRWPTNTLAHIEREWGLTTGEARGVLYAQASRSTLNKILRPRSAGLMARIKAFRLGLVLLGALSGITFDQFLQHEQERLRDERRQAEARDRCLGEVVTYLRAGPDLGG